MTSLRNHIVAKLSLTAHADIEQVFIHSISYLTGGVSAYAYQSNIRHLCKTMSAIKFRLSLCSNRYFLLDLKLWCLKAASTRNASKQYRSLFKQFAIHLDDRKLLKVAFESSSSARQRLRVLAKQSNYCLSFKEVDALLTAVMPDVKAYIKAITYRKLRFICKSQNVLPSDLEADLLCKCLQAFYKSVPTNMSVAHITNYLRQAAHNHAMNIIQSNTTEGRGRLISTNADNTQFSLLVVSQNQILATTAEGEQVQYDSLGSYSSKFELEYSVKEVLEKYKHKKKAYTFLLILMGEVSADFTSWLQAKSLCKAWEDNHDLQLRSDAIVFNRYVSEYLNVAEAKANVFLLKIKKELGYDCRLDSKAA